MTATTCHSSIFGCNEPVPDIGEIVAPVCTGNCDNACIPFSIPYYYLNLMDCNVITNPYDQEYCGLRPLED